MENNVQEDYKSEILDIVRSNASPGIMRDKLEDYHENDLAEVFPELTITERRKVYRILDILDEHEAKATFFIGGCWADDNAACVKEILSRGHDLGNHGYFHKDHASLSEAENKEEISLCNRFIELMTAKKMTLFAPPSGAYGKAALAACEALNMKTILWSRDTIDWRDKNAALIYTRATKNIKGGEFVLMHPMKETADALGDILTYYQTCSLRAVTVSENLQNGG